jgi:predicted glycoside hydrolase/deacetylase ChbG (UPF0249 family)
VTRRLVVNADDLGQSDGINEGIVEAVEHGIVTSTSLMVRWPAAVSAARWARDRSELSVGLHVDLGEWICTDEVWRPAYHVADTDDLEAVVKEVAWQVRRFEQLVGRPPSHVDSHQHVHREEPVRSVLLEVAEELQVPLRSLRSPATYRGEFYGQYGRGVPYPEGITFASLLSLLDDLPEGVTELGCHPGADGLSDLDSMYLAERGVERAVLCDQRLRDEVARRGIELISFFEFDLAVDTGGEDAGIRRSAANLEAVDGADGGGCS